MPFGWLADGDHVRCAGVGRKRTGLGRLWPGLGRFWRVVGRLCPPGGLICPGGVPTQFGLRKLFDESSLRINRVLSKEKGVGSTSWPLLTAQLVITDRLASDCATIDWWRSGDQRPENPAISGQWDFGGNRKPAALIGSKTPRALVGGCQLEREGYGRVPRGFGRLAAGKVDCAAVRLGSGVERVDLDERNRRLAPSKPRSSRPSVGNSPEPEFATRKEAPRERLPGRPGGCPPGLPQFRTCAINASGSSGNGLAAPRYTEWTTSGGGSGKRCNNRLKRSQVRRPSQLRCDSHFFQT